jgi:DNA-binding NarL/FixJ family response regulator
VQVAFRIFPEHVEVDVLHSESQVTDAAAAGAQPVPAAQPMPARSGRPAAAASQAPADPHPASFAEWMSSALRREGMTHEAAARQLGVSVKTVSRWVGGATQPRMRDLKRIQEVFGELPLH